MVKDTTELDWWKPRYSLSEEGYHLFGLTYKSYILWYIPISLSEFTCKYCNRPYKSRASLGNHISKSACKHKHVKFTPSNIHTNKTLTCDFEGCKSQFKNSESKRSHCYRKHGHLPTYKYKTKHSGGVSKQKHKKKSIISKTAAKLALTNDTTLTGKNVII